MNLHPIATVLIPARNAAPYIQESIESVLIQVSQFKFDVVVINDHSTDSTAQIVESLMEINSNVRMLTANASGISNALNLGINSSTAEIFIRHDADDIMLPGRIEEQVQFLLSRDDYAIYGGQILLLTDDQSLRPNKYPLSNNQVKQFMLMGNPFAHPTVALKGKYLKQAGLYNPDFDGAEDYELWSRMIQIGKARNSPNVLTGYRVHESQITVKSSRKVQRMSIKVQLRLAALNLRKGKLISAPITVLVVVVRLMKAQLRQ